LSETHEIDSIVRSGFTVRDAFLLPDGEMEYKVAYGPDTKSKFEALHRTLAPRGLVPQLTGTREDATLVVRRTHEVGGSSRIPVLALLLTVTSIAVFSLLETAIYQQFAPQVPPYIVIVGYSASILAILGAHELGHRYLARKRGNATSVPFFIPGIPDLTAFLPTLGVLSVHRKPLVNKEDLFDGSLAGPLAAFAVTVVLYAVGEVTSVVSSSPLLSGQLPGSNIYVSQINPSVVQFAIDSLLAAFLTQAPSGFFRLSPMMDAATVGFMLTFLSMMPAVLLDGGYMVLSAFGGRALRACTYLSIFALVALDTPNYWAIAIFILILAGRQPSAPVLDEISEVPRQKKLVFLAALILGFLCLPMPQNLLSLPLG
jgi:hypothetical protein